MVGRSKEAWIDSGVEEFTKRLSSTLQLTTEWVKDDQALIQQAQKEGKVICLDPEGKMMDSTTFSKALSKWLEEGGARLTFVIGASDGLPASLRSYPLISFSSMTFTHQMCRLILAEQIYRSTEIWRGSPYHK